MPVVVKKDGLAAGKGVIIADTIEAARSAIEIMYGDEEEGTVVFETFLEGEEFSLMTFVNGDLAVPSTVLHKIINAHLIMMKDQILVVWGLIVQYHILVTMF